MAQTISIGAAQHIGLLKTKLGRELKLYESDGLKVCLNENPVGKFTFLSCRVADYGEDTQFVFKHFLADVISDFILNHLEDDLLKDLIRENYYYFDEEERELIYDYALHHINRDGEDSRDTIYRLSWKSRIVQKVLDFLSHNNCIIIEGFVRFRLKEYVGELRKAADKAVDDFLMEREYREFIQLLKYFIDIQEPRIDAVHVLIKTSGSFKLFDDKMQPIKSDYLEGFIVDLVDSEINYEDLLISALITIAPRNIILHYKNGYNRSAMMETIKNVFTGRVSECAGCGLCVSTVKI